MPISFVLAALALCVAAALVVLLPARAASRAEGSSWLLSGGVFAALIVLGTAGFYQITSDWNWTSDGVPDSPFAAELYALQRAVHDNERDASAWAKLGRFYLQFETQLPAAIDALDRSISLSQGRDIDTNLNLVEALAIRGAPNDKARSAEILNASLKLEPDNRKALWYGSEVAASLGQWDVAIARWQTMLTDARSLNTEEARSVVTLLEQRITAARREQRGEGSAAAQVADENRVHGSSDGQPPEAVRVRVTLDRVLAQTPGLKPSTNLFVFIRPKGQGGPPLAVHRTTVGQLPIDVVMTDADAMMPSRRLSSFDELEIVARVALGGSPTMTPGDLFGQQELSSGEPRDVAIAIKQVAEAP